MTALAKLGALASAGVGTAAAASLTWMAVSSGAQLQPGWPSVENVQRNEVIVCIGSDNVLRTPDGETCASGRRVVLEPAENRLLKCEDCEDPWGGKGPGDPADPSDPIAGLTRRMDALKKSPLLTVVARGVPIFVVTADSVIVNRPDGSPVAAMRATDQGGFFTGRSVDGGTAVSIGGSGANAGLRLTEDDSPRIDLGTQSTGRHSLRMMLPGGGLVAGLGESRAGTGAALTADGQSRVRASMTLDDARGHFTVHSISGAALISLRESMAGSGLFSLGTADGGAAVKATVNDNRYGVVLAGPRLGFPLVTGSGVPGSYILGCSGADCRPY